MEKIYCPECGALLEEYDISDFAEEDGWFRCDAHSSYVHNIIDNHLRYECAECADSYINDPEPALTKSEREEMAKNRRKPAGYIPRKQRKNKI
jgi:hypothetical protein